MRRRRQARGRPGPVSADPPRNDRPARGVGTDIEFRFRYRDHVREFLRGAARLHVLHRAAEAAHGAWMPAGLACHGYRISPGSRYPALGPREAGGLLASPTVVADGRRRPVHRVTADGSQTLDEVRRQLREFADEVLGGDRG